MKVDSNKYSNLNHYPMYKASILAEELTMKYSQKEKNSSPQIIWNAQTHGFGESYFVTCQTGKIHIQAESPLAAAYAVSQLTVVAESNHLGDFLGQVSPLFPLRPLSIGSVRHGLGLASPLGMLDEGEQSVRNAELLCRRVIELGYNAIMLGNIEVKELMSNAAALTHMQAFVVLAHAFGLKVIIKTNLFLEEASKKIRHCPLSACFREHVISKLKTLCLAVPSLDYLFWDSSLLHEDFTNHRSARNATLFEIVTAEMHLLEATLPASVKLIFYIPSPEPEIAQHQAVWLPALCDQAGKNTTLAFSAVAGNCTDDHHIPHPFWEILRKSPDISSTPLLPLVNVGLISQGEGLWPSLATELLEKYYSRLYRHRFAGVMALTNAVPGQGSILDCNLWVAGQALWHRLPPQQLTQTWFAAFRPDWHYAENSEVFYRMRHITTRLSLLRSMTCEANRDVSSEECRVMTESIMADLKDIKIRLEKDERKYVKKVKSPSLVDYFQVFSRDAQRIVLHFLQCFNLSFPYLLEEGELQESFWTQLSPSAGKGIRSGSKIVFFDEPRRGMPGSSMEAIYLENRLI